jgi:hypothetical protein
METAHQELRQTFSPDQNRGSQKASQAGHGRTCPFGTELTSSDVRLKSAMRGDADIAAEGQNFMSAGLDQPWPTASVFLSARKSRQAKRFCNGLRKRKAG